MSAKSAAATRKVSFTDDVLPLLRERCFACHAGEYAQAGYRLDARRDLLGDSNGEPLSAEQIAMLRA